jgi:pimeloyl-ACP methyl ester carboxylesterase
LKRRSLLALGSSWALGLSSLPAAAKVLESAELSLFELSLPGDRAFGRALLAVPRALPENPELLVLLHGLGETTEQSVGARAFAERYGLLTAVARLAHPPLGLLDPQHDYFGEGRLTELNARLAQRPFRCPVVLCPFTPNTYKSGGDAVLLRFAKFVTGQLKAEAEQRALLSVPPARCMISGVSLGGYLAIELFLRYPEAFCAVGTAQGAFGPQQAARYALGVEEACARVGARRVEILTSSFDPYRRPNELFQQHLRQRKQASRLRVSPGPHDQRWLNESGVIEMLLCADDVFAEKRAEAP